MSKNTSVSLEPHFQRFIKRQIKAGRYATVSEVIRAGLRVLEEDDLRMQALQQALEDGEKSGFVEDFNIEEVIAATQ